MKVLGLAILSALLLFANRPALAGTPGVFRGTVVPAPSQGPDPADAGWLYVEGRNHLVRRVALGRAVIVYGEEIPEKQRAAHPQLIDGTEVRVTAEQDLHGEWHALRVEILGLAGTSRTNSKTALELKISETPWAFLASN